jgi:hypothetical protein
MHKGTSVVGFKRNNNAAGSNLQASYGAFPRLAETKHDGRHPTEGNGKSGSPRSLIGQESTNLQPKSSERRAQPTVLQGAPFPYTL